MRRALGAARWQEVDRLFQRVLDLPAGDRGAFLERACGGDAELRSRVHALLAAAERAEAFLESSIEQCCALPWTDILPAPTALRVADGEPSGLDRSNEVVGRYRLVRRIGRGGMATVYLAERADGQFDQRVAVKLLRRGLDTEDVVRRFVAERQILSSLSHPNIARLLDGGATADGLPYLVMEYVEGMPLVAYCDQRRMSVRDRLILFCDVARAVQHAHRRLVVHRDLKPSNILVDADGQVKLLDFGIAKLLEPAPGEAGTRTVLPPLTPEYASPEQIRGEAITTGSDIYQLGILLCQILSGRRPYEVRVLSPAALERAVTEASPSRPSDLVDEHSAHARRARPRELRRALRGDVDAIVLKALRMEPEARYDSCAALIQDIERHLDSRPITARRDTLLYGTRKLLRRRPWIAPVASALLLAVAAHMITLQRHATQLQRERNLARAEAAVAAEMTDFLADLFTAVSPLAGNDIRGAMELVEFGIARADSLVDRPEIRFRLLSTLGHSAYWLGQIETARTLLERSVQPEEAAGANLDPETGWRANQYLGAAHYALGDYAAAEAAYVRTLERYRSRLGPRSEAIGRTLSVLGWLYHETGDLDRAERAYREALAIHREVSNGRSPGYASALENLGLLLADQGRLPAAEAMIREALDVRSAVFEPDHANVGFGLRSLGRIRHRQGDGEAAETLLRQALEIRRKALGPDHHKFAEDLAHLAAVLADRGQPAGARALLEQALEIRTASLGAEHPVTAINRHQLATVLHRLDEPGQAGDLYRSAAATLASHFGDRHPWTLAVTADLERLRSRQPPARRDWLSGTRIPLPVPVVDPAGG